MASERTQQLSQKDWNGLSGLNDSPCSASSGWMSDGSLGPCVCHDACRDGRVFVCSYCRDAYLAAAPESHECFEEALAEESEAGAGSAWLESDGVGEHAEAWREDDTAQARSERGKELVEVRTVAAGMAARTPLEAGRRVC